MILENGVSEESLQVDVLDLVIGQLCLILNEKLLGWAHGSSTASWLSLGQSCINYFAILGAPKDVQVRESLIGTLRIMTSISIETFWVLGRGAIFSLLVLCSLA